MQKLLLVKQIEHYSKRHR